MLNTPPTPPPGKYSAVLVAEIKAKQKELRVLRDQRQAQREAAIERYTQALAAIENDFFEPEDRLLAELRALEAQMVRGGVGDGH